MEKFDRRYKLYVQTTDGGTLLIPTEFTMEFDITRNDLSGVNQGNIIVTNLSDVTRDKIRKDVYSFWDSNRLFTLQAGYGEELSTIFKGNINRAWSTRQGVDFKTYIEGQDGGAASINATTSQPFGKGTPLQMVIERVLQDLVPHGVAIGSVGKFPGELSRANVYNGPTIQILSELTNGAFYIDNMTAYCLTDKEVIKDRLLILNSQSGLLGTPYKEETNIHVEMLFEPRVKVGMEVQLESTTELHFNSTNYKVVGIQHKGIISQSVGGTAKTMLTLMSGVDFERIIG